MRRLPSRTGTSPIQCVIKKYFQYNIEQWQKIRPLTPSGRQGSSHFHVYCNGLAGHLSPDLRRAIQKSNNKNKIFIQINLIWLNYFCARIFYLFIFSFAYRHYNILFFQTWGDYADMSQGVSIYVALACNVFPICWFGTQMTQHVRVNGFIIIIIIVLFVVVLTTTYLECG